MMITDVDFFGTTGYTQIVVASRVGLGKHLPPENNFLALKFSKIVIMFNNSSQ